MSLPQPRVRGNLGLSRLWQFFINCFVSLKTDFGTEAHQKQLTLTFSFLSNVLGLLFLLTAIWSAAAGILQAGRLAQNFTHLFDDASLIAHWPSWFIMPLAAVVYAGKAFGVAMLVCLASASVGAVVGFIFGVPRPISESGPTPKINTSSSGAPSSPPPARAGGHDPGWQANTNLTQISDWLTKIIVGVGLVEAHKLILLVRAVDDFVSRQLFDGYVGTALVLPALIVAGLIFGFMYSYLFTQLFLAILMAYSGKVINGQDLVNESAAVLSSVPAADPIIAPAIQEPRSRAPVRPVVEPSAVQRQAALNIQAVPLQEINDPASVSVWSRAQALLNEYGPAVTGYDKLLQMWRTPEILAEAARVFASAQNPKRARDLIDEAARMRDDAAPESRARITFDAAHLALYDPPPAGYRQALSLLDDALVGSDMQGGLAVLRACANGQRYTYEDKDLTDEAKRKLRDAILRDLQQALTRKTNLPWVRYLLDRDDQGHPVTPAQAAGDDDLVAFKDDPDFITLVGPET